MADLNYICETDNIAAYVDGDLDPALRSNLEDHLKECAHCAAELQTQRMFMCELDSVLANPLNLEVPENFAQLVAVRAESDMRGVRDRAEHARALRFCIILGLAAFALLGVASSKAIVLNARSFASKLFGVLSFFGEAVFNIATGFSVITRVVSRTLITDSRLAGISGLLFVILAVGFLSRLIARYHRTRLIE
ncbi:MAG TPA: zf-HC2 domain-containing protein [Pyrinomonadaceae bacterium]|nr:zf-HC2 domain-containing protein [Pyrinomonadaceae bacterium]